MMTAKEFQELQLKHNKGKRANYKHEESKTQISCVEWFRYKYPKHIIFSIPNGGFRNAREGKILKAEGLLAGVADLFIPYVKNGFAGLFIEMKYGKGKQSPEQLSFQKNIEKSGYKYEIARNLTGFMRIVNQYL